MTTVLAIDQGTSGTKAVVIDGKDRILGVAEVPVSPVYLPHGGVEVEPEDLYKSVLDAARGAISESGARVDVLAFANQGETVLAWDRATGKPLSQAIVWQDRRAESITERLQQHKKLVEQKSGLVLDPYFSAPKQAWIRENLTRGGVVTTTDTWILHRLTGEFVTDRSTASRSLVLDLDQATWDDQLLEVFSLQNEELPALVDSDVIIGTTDVFGYPISVGGLIVDQQAALLAENCLQPGDAKCTFGTGAFMLVNSGGSATRSRSGLASSVAWQAKGERTYCLDGQVYTAASAVRWLENLGFISTASDLDVKAARNSEGVLCVPALAGLAAPWWAPEAKAVFAGMTLSTEPRHLLLAVLEGIAAQVGELTRLVAEDTGHRVATLKADGGLTQSRVLMQSVANLLQTTVEIYPSSHATPLGAAALGRMAADSSLTLSEAIVPWEPRARFTPEWSEQEALDFRERWLNVVETSVKS